MTRSVQRFDLDVADSELAAFVEQSGFAGPAQVYFQSRSPASDRIRLGAGALRQLTHPGEKIGVDYGSRGDGDDLESGRSGRLDVLLDIPIGVNDQRLTGLPAADEISSLARAAPGRTEGKSSQQNTASDGEEKGC
jgi:hypothetical protein